jgi:MFS family permease
MAPRLIADITPLRESRDFRFLFAGQLVSFLGRQLTVVAVPIQVFDITRSSLAVGLIGLADLVPLVVVSLIGGALADAFDRRKLLLLTQVLLGMISAGLALNAMFGDSQLWLVYLLSALAAGLLGIDLPTRNAVIPSLVSKSSFPAAAALSQIVMSLGLVAGPAIAGVLIHYISLSATYWSDAASFGLSFLLVLPVRPLPPHGGGRRAGLASVREGISYLRGRRVLTGTFVIDLNAMIFGMPRALFPAFGTQIFGGTAATVGLLYAAPGAGALVGALFAGWVGRIRHQGMAVFVAVAVWGAAVTGFGLSRVLVVALLLLAVAGAADVISAVFRNTILQLSIPDSVRGRLSAMHIAVVTSGPRLGDVESGTVAALTSVRVSAVSGGLVCIAGVLALLRLIPELARYKLDLGPTATPEPGAGA